MDVMVCRAASQTADDRAGSVSSNLCMTAGHSVSLYTAVVSPGTELRIADKHRNHDTHTYTKRCFRA